MHCSAIRPIRQERVRNIVAETICVCRLRKNVRYDKPLCDIVDSYFHLLKGFTATHTNYRYSWYRCSIDGTRPTKDLAAIEQADIIIIPTEAEFTWHIARNYHTYDVIKSMAEVALIAEAIKGKPIILLTSDRADTEFTFRSYTFPQVQLGPIQTIDETDFPGNVHGLKFWFISAFRARMLVQPSYERKFVYWGAANKRKLIDGTDSNDIRHTVLRDIKKRLGDDAFFIGRFPFRDMKYTSKFYDIIPEAMASHYTLCFNWLDPRATTARYIEAVACGVVPFVWHNYDIENKLVTFKWQRVSSVDELLAKMQEYSNSKWYPYIYEDLLGKIETIDGYQSLFNSALERALARCTWKDFDLQSP